MEADGFFVFKAVSMGFLGNARSLYDDSKKQYSLVSQATCPKIEIKHYDGNSLKTAVLISGLSSGSKSGLNIDTLQSYSFSRGIDDTEGSFTVRLKDRMSGGVNVFDSIENFDIVEITESVNRKNGAKPDFVGVIHSVKISSSIGSDGKVRKEISVSGKSAISLFSGCFMNLGKVGTSLYSTAAANLKIKNTFTEVEKDSSGKIVYKAQTLRKIVQNVWNDFKTYLSSYVSDVSTTSVLGIMNALGMSDFSSVEDLPHIMPVSTDLYNAESVSFMDMIRKIIPEGAYQIFSKDDVSLTVKECPFSPEEWKGLGNGSDVNLNLLTGYDFEKTDKEVYTVFMSLVEGSSIDGNYIANLQADENGLISVASNKEKIKKYGYKPLTVSFMGYVQNRAVKTDFDRQTFEELNSKLKSWYDNLDEMLAGRIKMVNAYEDAENVPRIGEKIVFSLFAPKIQETAFYIKSETHSWSYGASPMVEYSVERGAIYKSDGSFQGAAEKFSTALETALENKADS